jgi:hypothetical protein
MVKLLSVILVKTFNKSRFLKFLAAHMKSAQKLEPFALHKRAFCSCGNLPASALASEELST